MIIRYESDSAHVTDVLSESRVHDVQSRRRLHRLYALPSPQWASEPVVALTPTEQGITDLVSVGLTNRQVAQQVHLSPHTVNYHLRKIFQKLGIRSRVELTRYATIGAPDMPIRPGRPPEPVTIPTTRGDCDTNHDTGDEMRENFTVRIAVRGYEIDAMGHLNGIIYYQYAEHARWELLRAAGVAHSELLERGIGPVNLETTMRVHNELRYGNEVDVSCVFRWGVGKSFRVEQEFYRADGTLVAELFNVGGLMDLQARRLVVDPGAHFRELANTPELLGL